MVYLIQQYQAVWSSGQRDTVKFPNPLATDSLEKIRRELKKKHDCAGINLTYIELKNNG